MIVNERSRAVAALLTSGLCWGTTGIFVRVMGERGFSTFELLILRLLVVALLLFPFLKWHMSRNRERTRLNRTSVLVGSAMIFYYLGAIAAVGNLPIVLAVLLIGSSPLLAWLLGVVRILQTGSSFGRTQRIQSLGVVLGVVGLTMLALTKNISASGPASIAPAGSVTWIGYLGGFTAAVVTVINAEVLRTKGSSAPTPVFISTITAVIAVVLAPFLLMNSQDLFARAALDIALVLGFGVIATLIPGLTISYASTRLTTQATSTVSIQLQVWTVILAWLILGDVMSVQQIFAALLVLAGTIICLRVR